MPKPARELPVAVGGAAELIGVPAETVHTWIRRSKEWKTVEQFPEPDGDISGMKVWWPDTIVSWAVRNRRGRYAPGAPSN